MKTKVLTFIFTLHFILAIGQQPNIDWLKKNTIEFTNFSFIDKAVQTKKYVFIGESSHGAKEFYTFKTALTKYLIQKFGFEFVAIESPFIASYFYNYSPETRTDSLSHAQHILFPIFCNSITNNFIDTLDSRKIPVMGFDNQLGTTYQARLVTQFVYNKLAQIDSSIAKEYSEINSLFSKDNLVRFSKDESWNNYPCSAISDNTTCEYWLRKYNKFINFLESNYNQLLKASDNDPIKAFAVLRILQTVQIDLLTIIHNNDLAIRDSLMAKNIEFMVSTLYKNKKIIFLAHNAHIAKDYNSVKGNFEGDHRTMLSFLGKEIKDESIIIGLYGIEGSTNYNNRVAAKMKATDIDSTLEYHIQNNIDKQAYIDLEKYPDTSQKNHVYLCLWGITPETMNPKNQYDYLVFIKHLTPSTYLDDK